MRGPTLPKFKGGSEQPIRWARLERRWDVNRDVVRAGEVRNRFEGDVFRVVAPRVERSNREERPPKVAATVRREEFDERIGQERRRVRERTRDMDRSAEADIPPPPDGRDQRFDPRRQDLGDVPEDQRVTDGQARRERGSREPESETLRNNNGARIKPEDGIGRGAKSGAMGLKSPPKRHLLRTRHDWKRTSQRLQAASLRREERRRGRSGAQGQSQGREMREDQEEGRDTQRRQQRRVDQSEESRQGSPPGQSARRQRGSPLGRKLKAATVRHSGLRKMAGRNAEQGKGRMRSAGKAAASDQSESPQAAPPAQPPAPDGPGVQSARERSQRGGGEQNAAEKSRESRGDSERPTGQRKQAEAPKTPPENVQQRRQGGENSRQEQRSGPPAERRESNVQQQRQRGDQKAQGEKSGAPARPAATIEGRRSEKGDKSDSKGEGEGNTQSGRAGPGRSRPVALVLPNCPS